MLKQQRSNYDLSVNIPLYPYYYRQFFPAVSAVPKIQAPKYSTEPRRQRPSQNPFRAQSWRIILNSSVNFRLDNRIDGKLDPGEVEGGVAADGCGDCCFGGGGGNMGLKRVLVVPVVNETDPGGDVVVGLLLITGAVGGVMGSLFAGYVTKRIGRHFGLTLVSYVALYLGVSYCSLYPLGSGSDLASCDWIGHGELREQCGCQLCFDSFEYATRLNLHATF